MKVSLKVFITLRDWHHQCGDGCCDSYGTDIIVNGVECDDDCAGDDIEKALTFTLKKLGYEAVITREDE